MDHRFNDMMKLFEGPNGPLKKFFVKDSFGRNGFKSRGPMHKHSALHCNNGPVLIEDDEESHENVVEFIDEIAAREYDPKNPLMTYQRYRHTRTCRRGKENKKKCRFDIPNYVMKETKVVFLLKGSERSMTKHKNNPEKIDDLMNHYFENDCEVSSEDTLQKLQLLEGIYIKAIRSSLQQPKVFLRRKSNEVAMNAYNKIILT
ncbi:hypothetical protein QAD02_021700 [Eretmocerus hayati]|uniref:Uncharacterized protein n=1 Tax=Eretmocerus hayati TaxID=131215 RepID=A0ACC2PR79_9HYME|nr:hypothetical protein QAD02_021700 [Eretmocerus hayati]